MRGKQYATFRQAGTCRCFAAGGQKCNRAKPYAAPFTKVLQNFLSKSLPTCLRMVGKPPTTANGGRPNRSDGGSGAAIGVTSIGRLVSAAWGTPIRAYHFAGCGSCWPPLQSGPPKRHAASPGSTRTNRPTRSGLFIPDARSAARTFRRHLRSPAASSGPGRTNGIRKS
jgi:hypothetical protein